MGGLLGGGHLKWTCVGAGGLVVAPVQPLIGSRCGAPSGSLIGGGVEFKPSGKGGSRGSVGGWTTDVGGCGPSAPELLWGPQAAKSGAFHAERVAEGTACFPSSAHLLTVPGGLASGAQPRRFQNGIRCRCGEEEKGREGAAAQPPGLFCVGRLPLPVSAASAAAAASGCRRGGMPIDAARWAWEGCFGYCCLPMPSQGVTSQPLPRPITFTMVPEEMWGWGTQGPWPGSLC